MRELLVIGIGPGDPDEITVKAVTALNRVDVFFVVDKGSAKSGLLDVRDEILRRHVPGDYRIVTIDDPPRDRTPPTDAAYTDAVASWHAARAERFTAALDELGPDGVGAFLVWGDPALYDSTLRVIDDMVAAGAEFSWSVVAGVTSVHALAAAHRIPLNRIGEPIHITPARRVEAGLPDGLDSAVVMLDRGFSAERLDPDLEIFWGAYLSTPDEVLVAGRLGDVADEIVRRRAELRERHGWIMDTYLLRRPLRTEDESHTARVK